MTGKERVFKAIKCEKVDRVPWVPFVGCHGGSLIDETASNYLKSKELLVKGLNKAIKLYQPDGVSVMFDLQIEAEVLGCNLLWADQNPPAVSSHPLEQGVELSSLQVPGATDGRIGLTIDAIKTMRELQPDIALYGLITGPFTLALHLTGTNLFMKMFDDPNYIHDLMRFCTDVSLAMSNYFIEAGADIIAVVDPMTSQIGPDDFKNFVTPYATEIFKYIHSR